MGESGKESAAASAWLPLRFPTYRAVWIATVAGNIGSWVSSVGAAWLITVLAPSPLMVSLIQAATMLPAFVLALPAGALADIVDRRRLLIVTDVFVVAVTAMLGVVTLLGLATPWLVLLATFAIGAGNALSLPAFQAIVPDLVPRSALKPAVTLNSVGINVSRAIGPALGGAMVGIAGIASTFFFDAVASLGVIVVFLRWEPPARRTDLPAERFSAALRAALRFTRATPELRATLVRASAFFFPASAYWALLPLVARDRLAGGAETYGVLLACIGAGAVGGALLLPLARARLTADRLVLAASLVTAAVMVALPFATVALAALLMLIAGVAWIAVLAPLNIAAQVALPAWVRARGLSVYLAVMSGGLALGSPAWGFVAERLGIPWALVLAAACLAVAAVLTMPWRLPLGHEPDLSPSRHWPAPTVGIADLEEERGPVMVEVEYRVPPARSDDFARALARLGRTRRRDGAIYWSHFIDAADPSRHLEIFVSENWLDHLRQHERVTVADRVIQDEVRAYHTGPEPPRVSHYVAAPPRPPGDVSSVPGRAPS